MSVDTNISPFLLLIKKAKKILYKLVILISGKPKIIDQFCLKLLYWCSRVTISWCLGLQMARIEMDCKIGPIFLSLLPWKTR